VKENRSTVTKVLTTSPGQEPILVVLLGPDSSVNSVTVCSDGVTMCQALTMADGVLLLIAVYFLININYPDDYCQLLCFFQHCCLQIEFPPALRSTAFTALKESLDL
jgi:hypothetical protein